MPTLLKFSLVGLFVITCLSVQAATYSGNGNSGFGGPIGLGSLTLTDDGTTVFGTVNKGPNGFSDVLVIYIDSGHCGFADTSGFNDAGDGLRKAISGIDGQGHRSILTFPTIVRADYAIALSPSSDFFGALYRLASGGNNSLQFITSVNLNPTGNNNFPTYTFSFNVAQIGLAPNSGRSFRMVGTYVRNDGYRSDEAVSGNLVGPQGWNPFMSTAWATYTFIGGSSPELLVQIIGAGNVVYGICDSNVTLLAIPEGVEGLFYEWSGDASGSQNPVTVPFSANMHVTASFTRSLAAFACRIFTSEGSVVVSPAPIGHLDGNPEFGRLYASNAVVTLTATPLCDGLMFTGWEGAASGTQNPITVIMTDNKSVCANFVRTGCVCFPYLVGGHVNGIRAWWPGEETALDLLSGSIGTLEGGIGFAPGKVGHAFNLNGTDASVAVPGVAATSAICLEAWIRPNDVSSYRTIFSSRGYQLGLAPNGKLRMELTGNGSTFEFTESQANLIPVGTWTHVAGTFFGGTNLLYVNGTQVASNRVSFFFIWSPGGQPPSAHIGRSQTGSVIGPQYFNGQIDELTVYDGISPYIFGEIYDAGSAGKCTFSLSLDATGPGTASATPTQAHYVPDSEVTLTAFPAPDFVFYGWSGDTSGPYNPKQIRMTSNKHITAQFGMTLTVNTAGAGSATANPAQAVYPSGSMVTLTAIPSSGWSFTSWSGDAAGTDNPLTVTMTANKSITANFQLTLIVVNTNNSGPGSLRQAVADAPLTTVRVVTFAPNVTGTITLTNGPLNINSGMNILGPGANVLTINGNATSRVFVVTAPADVNISGLTLANGIGGISNNLHLNPVTLTVSNCVISGHNGNGIYNGGSGTMVLNNCTISGNSQVLGSGSFQGAGILNAANTSALRMTNCTVSGNRITASGVGIGFAQGGGIANLGNTIMSSCTISANGCTNYSGQGNGAGGGVYNTGTLTINNSIIAGNMATNTIDEDSQGPDCFGVVGVITSQGYNLIGKTNDSSGWTINDLVGSLASPLNPLLGPLQNNGGTTPTHALLAGSQALDKGNSGVVGLDQQQTNLAGVTGSVDQWQSFTAGISGSLTKVAFSVVSPVAPASSPGTLRIYAGEGTNGILIATYSITIAAPYGFQTFALSPPPQIVAGNQYTIRISVPAANGFWLDFSDNSQPYAGGRSSMNAFWDLLFKTYMIPDTTTDQRGRARPFDFPAIVNASGGDGSDIGAYEVGAIDDPAGDADGDGLPNGWEQTYGLDPNSSVGDNGANGDADHDGQNNLSEYLAGTRPNNASSYFRIIAFAREGVNARVTWTTASNHAYVVQKSALGGGLSRTNFQSISAMLAPPTTAESQMDYLIPGGATNGAAAYQVLCLPPPQDPADDGSQPAYSSSWSAGQNGGQGFFNRLSIVP